MHDGVKSRLEGFHEYAQSGVEGKHGRADFRDAATLSPGARSEEGSLYQRAVCLLECVKLGECMGHRQTVRVPGIHSSDKWIDEIVQQLRTEAACYERRERLVFENPTWNERLSQYAELGPERQQRRPHG